MRGRDADEECTAPRAASACRTATVGRFGLSAAIIPAAATGTKIDGTSTGFAGITAGATASRLWRFRVLREPLFEPLDRIVASEEFGIADQFLVERNGGFHPFHHKLLERALQA